MSLSQRIREAFASQREINTILDNLWTQQHRLEVRKEKIEKELEALLKRKDEVYEERRQVDSTINLLLYEVDEMRPPKLREMISTQMEANGFADEVKRQIW